MLLIAVLLLAQTAFIPSYTTADPVDPTRLGLATPDGRYAVVPFDGDCTWLAAGLNVDTYPGVGGTLSVLTPPGVSAPACQVQIEQRMDSTPCFVNGDGECDAAAEADQ